MKKPLTEYVCGFLFIDRNVVLIRKKRPEWQKGLLNGPGGKINPGENALEAMIREFHEEVGLDIQDWSKFAILSDMRGWRVAFFYSKISWDKYLSLTGGEPLMIEDMRDPSCDVSEVYCLDVSKINFCETIPNLAWLIPMALSIEHDRANQFEIFEYGTIPLAERPGHSDEPTY